MNDARLMVTAPTPTRVVLRKEINNPLAGVYVHAGTVGTVEQTGKRTVRVRFEGMTRGISVDLADVELL